MRLIRIRGAREHNLKNIDVDLSRESLIVMTGLSGSGKFSLAFDSVYAEGRRRDVESLSAYARQLLESMQKPEVELLPLQVGRANVAVAAKAAMSPDPQPCGPDR